MVPLVLILGLFALASGLVAFWALGRLLESLHRRLSQQEAAAATLAEDVTLLRVLLTEQLRGGQCPHLGAPRAPEER